MYTYDRFDIDNRVFHFIYGCALVDAVLQKSFKGERTWIGKVTEAERELKDYINRVITGEFKDNSEDARSAHDAAFLQTSIHLCNIINQYSPDDCGPFHFGNAQKLINMTVKHVYAHTFTLHSVGYPSIREHFRWCHCPMDQNMLTNVWDTHKVTGYRYKKDFCAPWGAEDFATDTNGEQQLPLRYLAYQAAIFDIVKSSNGDAFPIEYDYYDWNKDKE